MELGHFDCILEPVKTITQHSIIDVTKESPGDEERSGVPQESAAAVIEEGTKTPVRTARQTNPVERMTSEFIAYSSLLNCNMLASVHPIVMKSARQPSVDNNMKRWVYWLLW
jgi:hypothetical protein